MSERFKPYAAVLVLLIRDDEILLMRRFNTGWADGNYTVPSGHIDGNESVTTAAIREAKEEIGVDIAPQDISFAHVLHRKNNENGREYIDFFFVVENWQGTPCVTEPDKCDEVKWFPLNGLPSNTVPFVKNAVIAYIDKVQFSEMGW